VLAGFDELFGLAQSIGLDKDNLLVFGCWVEEIAIHKGNSKEPNLSRSLKSRHKSESNVRGRPVAYLLAITGRIGAHPKTRTCYFFWGSIFLGFDELR